MEPGLPPLSMTIEAGKLVNISRNTVRTVPRSDERVRASIVNGNEVPVTVSGESDI